ncbi:MAG: zinc ribbon domain-containing protein [Anaerolineae bacterium]
MITCPNCGNAVPANQTFCGNCGADVRAARSYQPAQSAPPPNPAPQAEGAPYAYESNPYGYSPAPQPRRPSNLIIWGVVVAVALICLCCGLGFGLIAGLYVEPLRYWIGPGTGPTPVPTPTGLLQFLMYV